MAGAEAIAATSRAVLGLLKAAAATDPRYSSVEFSLAGATDLQTPPTDPLAATLYLHHVAVNNSRGGAASRIDAAGRRRRPPLPLELHYLLTPWSRSPEGQQGLLGWCARVLYETPTLPAALLNGSGPVFRADETVELVWESLTPQVLYDIWQVAQAHQQPSATYVARIVEIEPAPILDDGPLVQTRDLRYGAGVPT